MGRNLDPKCKQCRRAGEKLDLKGERCNSTKCAMIKRNFPPGFHGPKGRRRTSDYGLQLAEKQKAKKQYGVLEKQFRNIFAIALKKPGNSSENLMKLLEMRLDNAVYRLGFASSRQQARQLINHGHFLVNGRKVSVPSYVVRSGEKIEIKESSKNQKIFKEAVEKIKSHQAPGWLNLDAKNLSGKILHQPAVNELPSNINAQMIVEYYSK